MRLCVHAFVRVSRFGEGSLFAFLGMWGSAQGHTCICRRTCREITTRLPFHLPCKALAGRALCRKRGCGTALMGNVKAHRSELWISKPCDVKSGKQKATAMASLLVCSLVDISRVGNFSVYCAPGFHFHSLGFAFSSFFLRH